MCDCTLFSKKNLYIHYSHLTFTKNPFLGNTVKTARNMQVTCLSQNLLT